MAIDPIWDLFPLAGMTRLEWDERQRAAYEAGDPDWLDMGNDDPHSWPVVQLPPAED